ncbi:MAG: hypothetical protein WHT08_17325 [Bryobacteraceae bacterium]
MSAAIQPETRLSVILEKHPELEQRLLTALPPLASVRSEAMRRSLLEGTTLESAARLAGLPVPEFVATVRAWAGEEHEEAACGPGGHVPLPPTPRPRWAVEFAAQFRIDADEMLATGVHPAGKVKQCASALAPGRMVVLTSSFCPSPLIQMMRASGFAAWTGETAPGRWESCFCRKEDAERLTDA